MWMNWFRNSQSSVNQKDPAPVALSTPLSAASPLYTKPGQGRLLQLSNAAVQKDMTSPIPP
ncbi:hypothetical protein DL95DRAFT_391932, partial [Leptodontidium sp. 2 PMI_412]